MVQMTTMTAWTMMPAGVPRSIVITCDNSAHCDSIIHKTSVGKISKDAMEAKLDWKWVKVQFSAAKSVKKFIGQVMNYISGSIKFYLCL